MLVEYADAPPGVRAVYDDIMVTRTTDQSNDSWKALVSHPMVGTANGTSHLADGYRVEIDAMFRSGTMSGPSSRRTP